MGDRRGNLTVLVVEDEALIAMDLAMMLEDLGCQVMGPFATEPKAMAALDTGYPDLALLDFNLGDDTSEDLARRLIGEDVPVAIITGLGKRRLPSSLERATVLQKPIAPSALENLVAPLLGEPRTPARGATR